MAPAHRLHCGARNGPALPQRDTRERSRFSSLLELREDRGLGRGTSTVRGPLHRSRASPGAPGSARRPPAVAGARRSRRRRRPRSADCARPPPPRPPVEAHAAARASSDTRAALPGPRATTVAPAARARTSARATVTPGAQLTTRESMSAATPGSTCGYAWPAFAISARSLEAARAPDAGHARRPRVELPVHVVDDARRQVRVDLGGRDVHVAEHRLHRPQIGAALEQVRREGVAQGVRRDRGASPARRAARG